MSEPLMPPDPGDEPEYLIAIGEELYTRSEYRARVDVIWKHQWRGQQYPEEQLTEAFTISATGHACSEYRAETASQIPLKVVNPDMDDTGWNPVGLFLMDSQTLIWHIVISLCIWGKAYLRKHYNEFGYPTFLEWWNPELVTPQEDAVGNIVGYYFEYDPNMIHPSQVVAFRKFDPADPNDGTAPMEVALRRIVTESSMMEFSGSFFFNHARPDGILSPRQVVKEDDIKKAKKEWKEFKGARNAHKTFVASGDWNWTPITPSVVDLAMPELNEQIRRDICTIFRVNPVLIGAGGVSDPLSADSTFDGIRRAHLETVTVSELGYIVGELNRQWLWVDFHPRRFYTLVPDLKKVGLLTEATNEKSSIAVSLANAPGILDYDEAREFVGYAPRGDGALKRDPTNPLSIWMQGGITLNRLLEMMGERQIPIQGNVMLIGGQLLPADRLWEIANANADHLIAGPPPPVSPFALSFPPTPPGGWVNGNPLPPPERSALPEPAEEPPPAAANTASVQMRHAGAPGCTVVLDLSNNPMMASLQELAQATYAGQDMNWLPLNMFHITMLNSPVMTEAQAQTLYERCMERYPVGGLKLRTVGLDTFQQPDYDVLVCLIEPDDALMEFQRWLYEQARDIGCPVGDYSEPDKFTPHCTMAYSAKRLDKPSLVYEAEFTPVCLALSRESYHNEYEVTRSWRALDGLLLAAALGRNQSVLYARRVLSYHLQEYGLQPAEWLHEDDWRLPLCYVEGRVSPSDASKIVKGLDFSALARVDVYTTGYEQDGDNGYLLVQQTAELSQLRDRLKLELEGLGYRVMEQWKPRILMCRGLESLPDPTRLQPPGGYPLVLNTLALYMDGDQAFTWMLNGASREQMDEIRKWQQKVGKKGGSVAFEPIALRGHPVADYVAAALADGEEAERVFAAARVHLAEGASLPVRASLGENPPPELADDLTATPEEYEEYWRGLDNLQVDLGADWLAYMERAWKVARRKLRDEKKIDALQGTLAELHDSLVSAWVGTLEAPGPVYRIILAGMAAGNESLLRNIPAEPPEEAQRSEVGQRRTHIRAQALTLDWALLNQAAYDFARQYSFELIRGLDDTTRVLVQEAHAQWIESGKGIGVLERALRAIFRDAARARRIANTESIRVYNSGAFERWRQVGVKRARWMTVRDGKVCRICIRLDGQIAVIEEGWEHPGGVVRVEGQEVNTDEFKGKRYGASAHPECRCFRRPIVD